MEVGGPHHLGDTLCNTEGLKNSIPNKLYFQTHKDTSTDFVFVSGHS